VKCKEIKVQNNQRLSHHTAQIFEDCLYVYGAVGSKEIDKQPQNEPGVFI